MNITPFSILTPDVIFTAAENFTGRRFEGTLTPYNSYVNRVFGLTDENGSDFIIKFYRPGRWTDAAILDEHQFLSDCTENEVPVVQPVRSTGTTSSDDNTTIGNIEGIRFSVFPKLRARTFDIYSEDDWIRTGRAVGRLHLSAQKNPAQNRLQCIPQQTTIPYIQMLLSGNFVTTGEISEFTDICDTALDYIEDAYENCFGLPESDGRYKDTAFYRIHGDCHRGNILEQFRRDCPAVPDTADAGSITFIDFDDMMTGPAIQDLWLLLPGYRKDSEQELKLLLEGYGEFSDIAVHQQLNLIEPLRFMRHIYFLAWTAIQAADTGFSARNPGWGTKAFWEKEIEDLKTQLSVLQTEYVQHNTVT